MNVRSDVSIVVPIKGRVDLFAVTAQSLIQQTHPAWEAWIVDDGSTPDDFTRIASICAADRRMRLIRRPGLPSGACAARNAGLAAATGEYVIFLDSDDALAPHCLERRLAHLSARPDLDFAVFLLWFFHDHPGDSAALWNVFDESSDLERFIAGDAPWQTSSPIWRRTALQRLGPWDTRVRTWQDGDFHLRALIAGFRYEKVPVPDAFWRAATAAGSIGGSTQRPWHVLNRIRMLGRMALLLRDRSALTEAQRRLFSAQFFSHAFRARLARRHALRVWRLGRQLGLVTRREYFLGWLLDGFERASRLFARGCIRRLYPRIDDRPRYGSVTRRISASDLPISSANS